MVQSKCVLNAARHPLYQSSSPVEKIVFRNPITYTNFQEILMAVGF